MEKRRKNKAMTFEEFLKTFDKKKLRVKHILENLDVNVYSEKPLDQFIFELQAINPSGYSDVGINMALDYSGCYYECDTPSIKLEVVGYKEETDKQYMERAKQRWKLEKQKG